MTRSGSGVDSHEMGMTEDMVERIIRDQAADLEHGLREGIQNAIDSGAGTILCDIDGSRSIILDDGSSVNLSEENGLELLTHLGKTTKRGDSDTIGEFGIGTGQLLEKGKTAFISDGSALLFNFEGWGVKDVRSLPADDVVEYLHDVGESEWAEVVSNALASWEDMKGDGGTLVALSHYDEHTPDEGSYKWDRYEETLKNRFKYVGMVHNTDLRLNGEEITLSEFEDSSSWEAVETELDCAGTTAYVSVQHRESEDLQVYSNGVYVTDVPSNGLSGNIVFDGNLALNFARNEIKSECPVWGAFQDKFAEVREELLTQVSGERLNSGARKYIAEELTADLPNIDTSHWEDESVFRSESGEKLSLVDIREKLEVGIGDNSDGTDILSGVQGQTLLASSDGATRQLTTNYNTHKRKLGLPDTFDPQTRADELDLLDVGERIPVSELTPTQRNKLGVARAFMQEINSHYNVHYGRGEGYRAWTDGRSFIVITDSAAPAGKWVSWVPQLFETLIHELAHKDDTSTGCTAHDGAFSREYRLKMENTKEAQADLIGRIDEQGIRQFRV